VAAVVGWPFPRSFGFAQDDSVGCSVILNAVKDLDPESPSPPLNPHSAATELHQRFDALLDQIGRAHV